MRRLATPSGKLLDLLCANETWGRAVQEAIKLHSQSFILGSPVRRAVPQSTCLNCASAPDVGTRRRRRKRRKGRRRRRRKREQEEKEEEERGKKEEGSWCMRLPATASPASTLAISPQVMIQSGCSALAGRGTQCELQQRRHAAHQRSGCRAVAPEAQTGGCAISAKQVANGRDR